MRQLFVLILLTISASGFAFAQDVPVSSTAKPDAQTEDETTKDFGDFTIELPSATWRVTAKAANVEMIYGDRLDGHLQIRKIKIDEGALMPDVIDREQNQKLQFLPGFVNGKEENFKGNLSGKVANYEFTQSGKAMTGRAYFLQADKQTVYVLRFSGLRDKLRLLRNQTDLIARSFELKKK